MAELLYSAVVKPFRHPAAVAERRRHFIDHLFAWIAERGWQTANQRLDLVGRQTSGFAGALVRVGRVDRMPFAADYAHRNLAFTLTERVAGAEIRTERPCGLRQLRVVHPDLGRAGEPPTGFDKGAIALLLLRGHLVIRDFGIAAKGRGVGHR